MSIKKNFFFNVLLSVSQIVFPLITFPYVTRILLPKGIGSVYFIDSIVQYIIIVAALGIPTYGVREIARAKHSQYLLNKTFSELILLHSVTSMITSFLFFVIALFVPRLYNDFTLCIVGVGLILSNIFTLNWFFGGLERFLFITIVSISVRVITICGIFLLVKTSDDKLYYYGLNLAGNLVAGAINITFASKFATISMKQLEFKKHFKPLILLFSLTIISSIYVLLDSVILGFIKNNEEVGYYTTAMRISKIPISLIAALTSVLIPKLTQIVDDNVAEVRTILLKSMDFTFILSIPIALGMFCLSQELLVLFAGVKFLPALPAFRILCFIIIPISFALVNYQILLPMNKEKLMMRCSVVGVLISLGLNFTLIPFLSGLGSAISSIVTEIVVASILFTYGRRLVDIRIPYRIIWNSLIACLIFFVIKFVIKLEIKNDILIVLMTGIFGSISYFVIMAVFFKNKIIIEYTTQLMSKFLNL